MIYNILMHIETFFEILGGCLQILNVAVMKNGFDRLEKKLETTNKINKCNSAKIKIE